MVAPEVMLALYLKTKGIDAQQKGLCIKQPVRGARRIKKKPDMVFILVRLQDRWGLE